MNKMLIKLADILNGNAKRRRTIKQRMTVAMMQTENHTLVAARAEQAVKARAIAAMKCKTAIHWRTDFHRHSV